VVTKVYISQKTIEDTMANIFIGGSNKISITAEDVDKSMHDIGITPHMVGFIVGGLTEGPEKAGREWAEMHDKPLDEHQPHFDKYQGGIAWVVRNKIILSHADTMLIYWDGKSAGARNLMNAGVKRGLTVYKIQVENDRIATPVLWDRVVPEAEWGWTSEW
jgi:hypothetical protein